MARQTSRATLLKELSAIQTKLKNLEKAEGERISRIAMKAGLGELELDDATLTAEFRAIADRFRKGGKTEAVADPTPAAEGGSLSGASSIAA